MSFEFRQRLMAEAILVKDSAITVERFVWLSAVLVQSWFSPIKVMILFTCFIRGLQLFKYFVQTFIHV